jgi:hypothetical protein
LLDLHHALLHRLDSPRIEFFMGKDMLILHEGILKPRSDTQISSCLYLFPIAFVRAYNHF